MLVQYSGVTLTGGRMKALSALATSWLVFFGLAIVSDWKRQRREDKARREAA